MDLEQLKAEHPALFEAAKQIGIEQERDRIRSHVTMGQKVGDIGLALASIRNGATIMEVMPHYLVAGKNRADIIARQEESDATQAILDGLAPPKRGDGVGDQVAAKFLQLIGADEVGAANIEDLEAGQ
jgi:hypothetical protein